MVLELAKAMVTWLGGGWEDKQAARYSLIRRDLWSFSHSTQPIYRSNISHFDPASGGTEEVQEQPGIRTSSTLSVHIGSRFCFSHSSDLLFIFSMRGVLSSLAMAGPRVEAHASGGTAREREEGREGLRGRTGAEIGMWRSACSAAKCHPQRIVRRRRRRHRYCCALWP